MRQFDAICQDDVTAYSGGIRKQLHAQVAAPGNHL